MKADNFLGSSFQYKSLQSTNSIRLLHLGPSDNPSSEISISLYEFRLQDAPPYEALSYTWGNAQDRKQVTVLADIVFNSLTSQSTRLSVTANCHSALCRLRHDSSERILWVDAICINQDDISERNTQVLQMGAIYRRASKVIIDVGEATKTSDEAINFITHYHLLTNTDDVEYNAAFKQVLYDMEKGLHLRDIIGDLYRHPWFSRVWVLQEAYLSRSAQLLCGSKLADWAVFRPFRIWVDSRPAWETEHWHVCMPRSVPLVVAMNGGASAGDDKRRYRTAQDFLELLCESRNCLASDQRDKIFALLPMMEFSTAEMETTSPSQVSVSSTTPVADYNKTTVQVYTETAAWLLPRVGLSLLSCATTRSDWSDSSLNHTAGLSSWIPDWSVRHLPEWMIDNPSNPVYHPLQASGDNNKTHTTPVIELLPSPIHRSDSTFPTNTTSNDQLVPLGLPLALRVRGVVIDTIHMLTPLDTNIRAYSPAPETLAFLSQARSYRTKLASQAAAPLPRPAYWTPKTSETRLHPPSWLSHEYGLPLLDPESLSDNEVCDYASFLCGGRRLAVTRETGYVGLVPETAREGDLVCVLFGGRVPFVLRSVDGGEGCYRLIGEAYVYGLMNGEGLVGADVGGEVSGVRDFLIV